MTLFLSQAVEPRFLRCLITFLLCVSGPVQSVIWLRVCDVCLGSAVQGVLQREQRQQRRLGVFTLPQRDHIWLWWGMRKNTVGTGSKPFSFCFLLSVVQLLSKPKFSSVEKIKTIGSTYMAAAGLTLTPVADENKVFIVGYTHIHIDNC